MYITLKAPTKGSVWASEAIFHGTAEDKTAGIKIRGLWLCVAGGFPERIVAIIRGPVMVKTVHSSSRALMGTPPTHALEYLKDALSMVRKF